MSNYKELSLEKSCLVDFLTHRPFIQQKLVEGYSRHSIWKGLFDAKMIGMTYSYFLRLCRDQLQEKSRNAPRKALHSDQIFQKSAEVPPAQDSSAPSQPSESLDQNQKDGSYMLGGFKMDPNRPKRAAVDMPKTFEWNPVPLTKEEIKTGKITSR
jgi:hypothetical protein